MAYEIVRVRKLVKENEIKNAGGDIGVVVKIADGRMAAGFAYLMENAILIAIKNAEAV